MNPALEDQLKAAFPQLYRSGIGFYFECEGGWFTLLWRLSERLKELISQLPEPEQGAYYAVQVKEKFGQLDYHLSSFTEDMFQATVTALEESGHICEICGAPGTLLLDSGWLMTRCLAHRPSQD